MRKTKKNTHKKKRLSLKKTIKIYLLYLLLFVTISAFPDYYIYDAINILWLLLASVFLSLIPTYIRYKTGERAIIEDIADDFNLMNGRSGRIYVIGNGYRIRYKLLGLISCKLRKAIACNTLMIPVRTSPCLPTRTNGFLQADRPGDRKGWYGKG